MIKKIAVINDLSGLGKCSLTAAIPVISVLGVQAIPLPTAILTSQTGYESYYSDDYTDKIDHYTDEWQKQNLSLNGICTGYLGSEAQVEKILRFCRVFKKEDTLLFVDPVMGDMGKPYDVFTAELRKQMKRLVLHADVISPNLTELCLLTDTDYPSLISHKKDADFLDRIAQAGISLIRRGIKTVLVTGIIYQGPEDSAPMYYNLILTATSCETVKSGIHGGSYSGTGDLMAAIVCASMVRGESCYTGVKRAAHFIEQALIATVAANIPRNDGILFEPYLPLLLEQEKENQL